MKLMQWMPLFLLILMLGACGAETTPDPEIPEEEGQQPEEEQEEDKNNAYRFFMEDGTTAYFKGEGNEFAQLTVRTVFLEENHIAVYEANGGTTVLKVYRIEGNAADLVLEQPEFYEEYNPSIEELQGLEPIARYIELPINVGDQVNGKEVVLLDALAETPFKNFDQAIMTEKLEKDGAIVRSYFVEGYGEVKREFIMGEGSDEFRVTSSLETIE